MGLILQYEDGQTPLDDDEKEGLLIASVNTKGELDEVEQRNIEDAIIWTIGRRKIFRKEEILTEAFIKRVHVEMFGKVWAWAGGYRNTNKNIGVDKYMIATELRILLDDCKYWIANNTFPEDEIALRFKHRVVSIHCFPNGNGRHSRLMADIIIEKVFNKEVFSWGTRTTINTDNERTAYLASIRAADRGDYSLLLAFARS